MKFGIRATALLTAVAALLGGCAWLDDLADIGRLNGACGIAVDGSGSANASSRGFDAMKEAHNTVEKFLDQAGCRYVTFAPISTAPESIKCGAPTLDLDPDDNGAQLDTDQVRPQLRKQALDSVEGLYQCIVKTQGERSTDVLGGMRLLMRQRPTEDGEYRLLIISDFIDTTPPAPILGPDLVTPAGRGRIIASISSRIPDLNGSDVTRAGFGKLFSNDSTRMQALEAFWQEVVVNRGKASRLHDFGAAGGAA
ncbi:hypothetical protein QEZ54_17805 [Catellatospora sp. KI3]|uniref:hypothetical protein n=1 Tax=Catellatospora sp. KI3 TaxID=3041620 RepID=UPI0024826581|nr:hypothetical protein [Catellatospora sp. KI3]MDI1462834.1 hypothetical protein [Catellatospora sp. KI3]